MSTTKTKIMNLLEMRFDYQSARNVIANWRKAANIKDDSENFDDVQLKSLLAYLKENAPDAVRVQDAIERLILADDAKPVVEEAPVAEVVEEAPVAETVDEAPAAEAVDEAPVAEAVEETPAADAGKKKKKSKK